MSASKLDQAREWVRDNNDVEALLAPSLPTLADMAAEERQACQWMRAELRINAVSSPVDCVIAMPGGDGDHVRMWHEDGSVMDVTASEVTPLPGEPKLERPKLV